ncbi:uncharacterized protein [Emydura macquarii macquarii]|uniref:uncharacterized protein n=1 Tax=Emydura macquarii macquarii TaxID=1129001 RepID=UPI00352ADCBC
MKLKETPEALETEKAAHQRVRKTEETAYRHSLESKQQELTFAAAKEAVDRATEGEKIPSEDDGKTWDSYVPIAGFQITPEVYRMKFRSLKRDTGMTHSEYAYKLCDLLKKWVKGGDKEFIKDIKINGKEAVGWRDSGAQLFLVRPDWVLESDMLPGQEAWIQVVGGSGIHVPMARVQIQCEGLEVDLRMGVLDEIPTEMLIGNDFPHVAKAVSMVTCSGQEYHADSPGKKQPNKQILEGTSLMLSVDDAASHLQGYLFSTG